MDTLSYKTKSAKKEEVSRTWYVADVEGKSLGRISSRIAHVLRGKHRPDYTPHVDTGDYVIIINAEKVKLTGNKMNDKVYLSYSGYPGGQKSRSVKKLMENRPGIVIEKAVRGMLPKSKLGRAMIKKMFVYAGAEHPHQAQKPETFKF